VQRQGTLILLALIIVAYVTISALVSLTKIPYADEAWFASPAINLVREGHMGNSILEVAGTQWLRMDEHTYWQPPMHFLAQAGWYSIFGFSLFTERCLSMFWGILALVSVFFIGRALFGIESAALLGTAALALDFQFIYSASDGRMDMMCVAFALMGYAAYLLLRERHLTWAILAGNTGIVISGLTHTHGIVHFVGLVVLILLLDRKNIRPVHILYAVAPYVVGAIGWGLYIIQDPEAFRVQLLGHISRKAVTDGGILVAVKREIMERYLLLYGLYDAKSPLMKLRLLILAAYAAGVVGAVAQIRRGQKKGVSEILILLAIYFVLQTFLIGEKSPYYMVHVLPFYAMLLGVSAVRFKSASKLSEVVIISALVIFFSLHVGISSRVVLRNEYRTIFLSAAEEVRKAATGADTIMGTADLAFEIGFIPEFIDDPALGYFSGRKPDVIAVNSKYEKWFGVFERQRPDLYEYTSRLLEEEFDLVSEVANYKIYKRRSN